MILRHVLIMIPLAGSAAAQTSSVETVRDALPGVAFYSETFSSTLAGQILEGYGDTQQQSPDAVARMAAAFDGRFQGGTLMEGATPELGLQTIALVSPVGDVVARFFIPVSNLGGSEAETEAGLRRYFEAVEAITGVAINQQPAAFIEQVWNAGGFVRVPGPGSRSLYAWGVAPDFVEITYSSLGDDACPFLPAKGWWARQTCP